MFGTVRDGNDDDDDPMPNVTIKVTGKKGGYEGPFYATTGSDGKYSLVIGELEDVGAIELGASVFGDGVNTENAPRWITDDDCDDDDSLQIMKINWAK